MYTLTPKLSNIFSQCTQDFPQNYSSHDPVFATLLVPGANHTSGLEKYSHTYSDFTQTRVIWDENNLDDYQADQRFFSNTNTQGGAIWPPQCILFFLPLKFEFFHICFIGLKWSLKK